MKRHNNLLIAMLVLFIQDPAMAIEKPDYQVIETFENFELRRYEPYLVAEVDVDGRFAEAGNTAFRILAGFIFGANENATKMSMTAPVESRRTVTGEGVTASISETVSEETNQTTYAFVMEQKYSLDTLPVPNDDRIRIRIMPARVMAVRRYSGRWTQKNYLRNEATLRNALEDAGISTSGSPVLARYNSPFSLPIMRRNEVMIEISLSG